MGWQISRDFLLIFAAFSIVDIEGFKPPPRRGRVQSRLRVGISSSRATKIRLGLVVKSPQSLNRYEILHRQEVFPSS
jgi:hypothetical protein